MKYILKILVVILLLPLLIMPSSAQISWLTDYYEAKNLGELHNKPIVVYFFLPECSHCIQMEETFKDPLILARQNDFIWVRINTDDIKYHNLRDEYGLKYAPTTYFLYPNGTGITYIDIYMNATRFRRAVDFAYSEAEKGEFQSTMPSTPKTTPGADIMTAALSILAAMGIRKILPPYRKS